MKPSRYRNFLKLFRKFFVFDLSLRGTKQSRLFSILKKNLPQWRSFTISKERRKYKTLQKPSATALISLQNSFPPLQRSIPVNQRAIPELQRSFPVIQHYFGVLQNANEVLHRSNWVLQASNEGLLQSVDGISLPNFPHKQFFAMKKGIEILGKLIIFVLSNKKRNVFFTLDPKNKKHWKINAFYPFTLLFSHFPGTGFMIKKVREIFPDFLFLYDSLSQHCFCYFYETSDICTFHVVYITIFFFSVISTRFVNSDHDFF